MSARLLGLLALLTVLPLAACEDEASPAPAATPTAEATPTSEPTVAPTATRAPEPTSTPAPARTVTTADVEAAFAGAGATWRELFNILGAAEQACIREGVGEDLEETLDAGLDEAATEGHVVMLRCLPPDLADIVFVVGLISSLSLDDLGIDREVTPEERRCLDDLVEPQDAAALMEMLAEGPSSAEAAAFAGRVYKCIPDLLIALIIWNTGVPVTVESLDVAALDCMQEAVSGISDRLAGAVVGQEEELAEEGFAFLRTVYGCAPDIFGPGLTGTPAPTATPTPTPTPAAIEAAGRIAFTSNRAGNQDIYVMNADGSGATPLTGDPADDWYPRWSPDGERITFESDRDGDFEIYVMNADGSGVTQLTDNPATDLSASWSPDGRRIAFESDRNGSFDIYVMNADGSDVTRLTDRPEDDEVTSWSPDGERIVFQSDRDIYVMNADGSGVTQLTDDIPRDEWPSWSPDGRIAFASDRGGNWDIYVMNADGSGVTRLTDHPSFDQGPTWSPDGERIVFHSYRDGNWDVYVMNADGSGVTQLTDSPASDSSPSWSPAATGAQATGPTPTPAADDASGRIAFVSDREGSWDIYAMNADGSGVTRLTDDAAWDQWPSWSPDGMRIAFHSDRDGSWDIYAMNADGSDVTRLTDDPASDLGPSWSPDGRRIAFYSDRDGDFNIYAMNADGSGATRLTDSPEPDWHPSWSPDGGRIAFVSEREGSWDIYVMNADGSGVTRLTDDTASDLGPSWSPDGRRIAFESDRDGNWDIYVMNADGSGVTRLTDNPAIDRGPSWSPDGQRIAFMSSRDGDWEVYVMNADGSGVTSLTDNRATTDWYPRWSPAATPASSAVTDEGEEYLANRTKAFVDEALVRYERDRREATLAYYNSPEQVDGQWYVFIVGEDHRIIAHYLPDRVGLDANELADSEEYLYGQDILKADETGRWVSYVFLNPETGEEQRKHSWVVRRDGLIFGSGWYE